MAYGKNETVITWRGEFPAFNFSALLYPDNEGVVHVIAFLVEKFKKEHPDPTLIKF